MATRRMVRGVLGRSSRWAWQRQSSTVAVVGLGNMGSALAQNLADAGCRIFVHDRDPAVTQSVASAVAGTACSSVAEAVSESDVVMSIVPNDEALTEVVEGDSGMLEAARNRSAPLLHVSCSTVSPFTSRKLSEHQDITHVSAPVFARPDGLAARQAFFPVSGADADTRQAVETLLLNTGTRVFDFGDDAGAANVMKLCGNFLIAASIESIAESLALAEKNGLDRTQVMDLLTSTIFDCLIFKGYGERVATRDHRPGGFSLVHGHKDVSLVLDTARKSQVPMPVGSVLQDRWLASLARGRGHLDWSAVGLSVSEDSGVPTEVPEK
uniref:6-phosphogluconate dehydrogenase NADP-binding domain-containing protein n=1 Tax=Rhizochromulina marina TaxID=1034831 RepID=A0A7S2SSK4_9STRA|mmetsp:Transcript_6333/g.18543  ORF Transcript_6333/g.18543 Transcript_6333/m.18543 type:complete len:325 (+) Transcript_6333:43-1017(+)